MNQKKTQKRNKKRETSSTAKYYSFLLSPDLEMWYYKVRTRWAKRDKETIKGRETSSIAKKSFFSSQSQWISISKLQGVATHINKTEKERSECKVLREIILKNIFEGLS